MKIAEGPTERADAQRRVEQLRARITPDSQVDLGPDGSMTDALAARDVLRMRHALLVSAADAAAGSSLRHLRSELRQLKALPVGEPRSQADEVARALRTLEGRTQEADWTHELLDQSGREAGDRTGADPTRRPAGTPADRWGWRAAWSSTLRAPRSPAPLTVHRAPGTQHHRVSVRPVRVGQGPRRIVEWSVRRPREHRAPPNAPLQPSSGGQPPKPTPPRRVRARSAEPLS